MVSNEYLPLLDVHISCMYAANVFRIICSEFNFKMRKIYITMVCV